MKLIHLSDLHIGKRLMDVSLLEEQKAVFSQILSVMDDEQPDAVLIAGDVYDRSNPSPEAMELLDDFLNGLAARGKPVLMISGNHDSAERLTFARSFLEKSRIHVSPVYEGHIEPIVLKDEWGDVCFWLMPYVYPENAARFFQDREISNANEAAEAVIGEMKLDSGKRNVILSHQLILGGKTSDSERRSVGTLENVEPALYDAFDYVALGHLHRPQNVGRPDGTMRYSGTPLVYSRSEINTEKSVTVVEMGPKGSISVRQVALAPKHPVRLIHGMFEELMQTGPEKGQEEDFFFIDLNDPEDIPNGAARLRERFPHMLAMRYDNERTRRENGILIGPEDTEEKPPLQLMQELYRMTHGGTDMSPESEQFFQDMLKKVGGQQQ